MEIYQKLKERRKELGLTMLEIAQKIGVSEATVSRWESGDIANMKRDKIVALSNALQVNPSFIMGWEDNLPAPNITEDFTTFPVIGEVAAGFEHQALEDWEGDTVNISNDYLKGRNKNDFFVLRVKGDSMYPEYQDGDRVLILKQPTVNYSGQVGVVIYNDELGTLKKIEYKPGENWIRLVAINPAYSPKKIENEELEHCRILGIPKLIIREVEE